MTISEKYRDLMCTKSKVDVLEGTTFAGKTTIGFGLRFIQMMRLSTKNTHLIAGESVGTIERNIIIPEYGLLDLWGDEIQYNKKGRGNISPPHLKIGKDIVYLVGFGDISKYKKALGGQFGAIGIDEINIANMDFVSEIFLPRYEYMICTLNPDDPKKPVYTEYIDRSRPIEKYKNQIPQQIQDLQAEQDPKAGWNYWNFTFDDNDSLTPEKRKELLTSTKAGTVKHKTKIQGVRTKAVGIIFRLMPRNIITPAEAKAMKFVQFTAGLDTSYSQKTADTLSWSYEGITKDGIVVILDEITANNKNSKPIIINGKSYNPFSSNKGQIAPSDTTQITNAFMMKNKDDWGFSRQIFIDNADAATLSEMQKAVYRNGWIFNGVPSYKIPILDRIILQNKWMASGHFLIVDTCTEHINECNNYAWNASKDNVPEDGNDHTVNSSQYGWIPYRLTIGG